MKNKDVINYHAADILHQFSNFIDSLEKDHSDDIRPKKSKEIASKIMKEWAKSISANEIHNKSMIKNNIKYAKLVKSIADFLE